MQAKLFGKGETKMSRRVRGSAVEIQPGVWQLRAPTAKDHTGKYGRRVKTFHGTPARKGGGVPRDVVVALDAWVREIDSLQVAGPQHTFAELTREWLKLSELEDNTIYGYEGYLRRYLLPEFGSKKVSDISAYDLDVFYKKMKGEGYSARTIRQAHAIMRSALAKAVVWKWITINPAATTSPRLKDAMAPEVDAPTVEEFRTLRAYLAETNPLLECFVVLSASLGTRKSEALALRYCDVDMQAQTVNISRSLSNPPGYGLKTKSTKTGATGTISATDVALALVAEARERAEKQAANLGISLPDDAYIFTHDPAGRAPWLPSTVTQWIGAARDHLGLPKRVTLKNLRHYHATQLIAAGHDISTVASRLRHTQKSTTLNFYAKKDDAADRRAADKMGEFL